MIAHHPAGVAFIFVSSARRVGVCTLGWGRTLDFIHVMWRMPLNRLSDPNSCILLLFCTLCQTLILKTLFSLSVRLHRSLLGWRVWRKDAPRSRRWVRWRWQLSTAWHCPECLCPMKERTTRRTRLTMRGWEWRSLWLLVGEMVVSGQLSFFNYIFLFLYIQVLVI